MVKSTTRRSIINSRTSKTCLCRRDTSFYSLGGARLEVKAARTVAQSHLPRPFLPFPPLLSSAIVVRVPILSDAAIAPLLSNVASAPLLSDVVRVPLLSDVVRVPLLSDAASAPLLSDAVRAAVLRLRPSRGARCEYLERGKPTRVIVDIVVPCSASLCSHVTVTAPLRAECQKHAPPVIVLIVLFVSHVTSRDSKVM
jgi:hypothetical protein